MKNSSNDVLRRVKQLAKPELHRHIEGCVRTGSIIEIARRRGIRIPTEDAAGLDKIYKLRARGQSLDKVLEMFELARSCFYSYDEVERLAYEAAEDAYFNENIRLLELRYSPDFMLGPRGLDWQKSFDVIDSALRGFEKRHNMVCGIILICSRGLGPESALKTAGFAAANKKRIIGFDFADGEKDNPPEKFAAAAAAVRREGISLTVHSGEDDGPEGVRGAVEIMKPSRIGHGVRAAEDATGETMRILKKAGITLETNPWSNYLTTAVESVEKHPLGLFIRSGLSCSIGADDPAILDTDLNREYLLAVEKIGLSFEDIDYCRRCAVEASFLPDDKKQQALAELGFI